MRDWNDLKFHLNLRYVHATGPYISKTVFLKIMKNKIIIIIKRHWATIATRIQKAGTNTNLVYNNNTIFLHRD